MKSKRMKSIGVWVSGFVAVATMAASPALAKTYRLASRQATAGFEMVRLADGSALYLGDVVEAAAKSCDISHKRQGHKCAATLSLSGDAAARVAMRVQRTGVNLLATSQDNTVTELAEIDSVGVGGIALRPAHPVREVGDTKTALFSLSADSAAVVAGDAVSVDVFVSDVPQLRTFQVAVEATGGASGSLDRVGASVDRNRTDYVFASTEAIDAADQQHGRIGATTMGGSVTAQDAQYLGTFTFVASRDASGSFEFVVRPRLSFLSDADVQDIAYRANASTVRVAKKTTTRTIR